MNTSPRVACQTSSEAAEKWRVRAGKFVCVTALFALLAASHAGAQIPPAAAPPPPAWQQELDALRLLEGSQAVATSRDPAEANAREQRLTRLYRELRHRNPARAAVPTASGDYERREERPEEAMEDFRRAQVLEPGDAETANALGSVDLELGRTREASEQLRRAVNASPGNAAYHFALANTLYLFRQEIATSPAPADDQAVLTQALTEFQRAAELAPRNLGYAQGYAETFYMLAQPDWEQARTAWKAVLALDPANADYANLHLARVSLRLKHPAEAENYLTMIRDPGFDALKSKLREQAARMPPTPSPHPPL